MDNSLMTNTIAIAILVMIGALFVADQLLFQWALPVNAARAVDGLIEYLSFWR